MNKNDSFNAQSASSAQLDAYLRDWLDKPEAGGEEEVLAVLDELSQREEVRAAGRVPDAKQAWERFQSKNRNKSAFHWRKYAAIGFAAVLAVVFCMVPAYGEESGLEVLASWTSEQLEFETSQTKEIAEKEELDLAQLIEEERTDELPLPAYMPEGFTESENSFYNDSFAAQLDYLYENGEQHITILIVDWYIDGESMSYEKDDATQVETYQFGDYAAYIFTNLEENVAAWYQDGLECSISTNLSQDELKQMLDSIS